MNTALPRGMITVSYETVLPRGLRVRDKDSWAELTRNCEPLNFVLFELVTKPASPSNKCILKLTTVKPGILKYWNATCTGRSFLWRTVAVKTTRKSSYLYTDFYRRGSSTGATYYVKLCRPQRDIKNRHKESSCEFLCFAVQGRDRTWSGHFKDSISCEIMPGVPGAI